MNKKDLVSRGKQLSFLLRHDKNYKFDEHGYRTVQDLIDNYGYSIEELDTIVETNDKKRYEYNEDKSLIRARQGHSVNVDVDLKEMVPPDILYHGTTTRFYSTILKEGIKKMNRQYVHLSDNYTTAVSVGSRHGSAIVITIDTKKMRKDGYKFYLSNNGVWLTDYVKPDYILK